MNSPCSINREIVYVCCMLYNLIVNLVKTMKNCDNSEATNEITKQILASYVLPTLTLTVFPGSVKADSVILALKLQETNFTVQARICGQDWYPASVTVTSSHPGGDVKKVRVQSLSPYTCYEFLLVQWEGAGGAGGGELCPLKSPVSQSVRTEGSGLASSPPVIRSVRQLPRLNINITFDRPVAPNGRM